MRLGGVYETRGDSLLESDREKTDAMGRTLTEQYSWDEIKPLFDHNAKLRVTGVKSGNSDTEALIFRGAVCISQNTIDRKSVV